MSDRRGTCEVIRSGLAELSLGILSGDDRSFVLEHVGWCLGCSTELEQLSMVADAIFQLAPDVEPPLGLERRLAERTLATSDSGRSRPSRFLRAVLAAAAAVAIAAAGVGIGRLVMTQPAVMSRAAATGLTTERLSAVEGQLQGEVLVSSGKPAWLFMTIDSGPTSGVVRCAVTLASGRVETVGLIHLSDGYGAWGGTLGVPRRDVRSAQVVSPSGVVLASAAL